MDLRSHASMHVARVRAAERVELRRWLRKNAPREDDGKLPDHMYLVFSKHELMKLVDDCGGDSVRVVSQAREAVIDRIMEGV